jgi:hypothetical protein
MQRSKTATDPGVPEQAAGAVTLTAPTGKHRSNTQHLYVKRNNSHPTPRPIAASTTSHPILVVHRRATRIASLATIARAQAMGPSGAHHPSATRRTAARPSPQQTRGKHTSFKSMDIRRSQRHHRSSPHSRTERVARSSSSSHSGQWERYTACKPRRRPSANKTTTRKTTPAAASAAIAACQSKRHRGHSSGGTTHLEERRNQLKDGQEGIPPSERINHPLSEEVQAPIREDGQQQARCKGIIRAGDSPTTIWATNTSVIIRLIIAAENINSVAPDTTTSRHCGDKTTYGRGTPWTQPWGTEATIRGRTQVHPSPQPTRSRVRKYQTRHQNRGMV